MPNTLAHLGAQTVATRALLPGAAPVWIFAGCVLPDLPWILQRAAGSLAPGIDPYVLRLYAVGQASLAVCLILAAGLAALSRRPGRTFAILASGALLHLLLDACQEKPGSGVHLFAPVSWALVRFDLFRIESAPTLALTVAGALAALWALLLRRGEGVEPTRRPRRLAAALAALLLYAGLPVAFVGGARAADVHYVRTLQAREERVGRPIAFDRVRYGRGAEGPFIETWAGERLALEGASGTGVASGEVSLRGRFVAVDTVRVELLYAHWPGFRALANAVGLGVVGLVWLGSLRESAGAGAGGARAS